jgi:phytol kinase
MSFDPTDYPLWLRIAIVPIFVGSIILTAELWHRYRQATPEQTRKIVHIGTGNVILIAWLLKLPTWVGIASAVIAGVAALVSYYVPILSGVNSIHRRSFGTFFYAVSIGIVTAVFWPIDLPYYGVIGILIMSWGDGLAAVIGQKFGRNLYRVWGNKKSWEGTLTMLGISYLIVTIILVAVKGNIWQSWTIGIPVAIAATAIESLAQFGLDNLTVPLCSAGLVYLLDRSL